MPQEVLSSQWGNLNPNLLARFQAIDYDGKPLPREPEVTAPLLEGARLSLQSNWQSVLENTAPESSAPGLTALIQSGALAPLSRFASDLTATDERDGLRGAVSEFFADTERAVAGARGLTGITKLNSTQIFRGMPPLKISLQAIFRAWRDPVREVEMPVQRLKEWAVPKRMAPEGFLLGAGGRDTETEEEAVFIRRILPSEAPTLIRFSLGKRQFPTMVIESIDEPITSPINRDGDYVECILGMELSSLTALDRRDLADLHAKRQSTRIY